MAKRRPTVSAMIGVPRNFSPVAAAPSMPAIATIEPSVMRRIGMMIGANDAAALGSLPYSATSVS